MSGIIEEVATFEVDYWKMMSLSPTVHFTVIMLSQFLSVNDKYDTLE